MLVKSDYSNWPNSRLLLRYLDKFQLPPNTIHGPKHWARVRANGVYIAERLDLETAFVTAFAWLHDCCRESDYQDPDHGRRAAEFAKTLLGMKLFSEGIDFEKLLYALEFHNKGRVSEDPIIGVCWDADRLDIGRAGIYPSAEFMSTKVAKDRNYIATCYEQSLNPERRGRLEDEEVNYIKAFEQTNYCILEGDTIAYILRIGSISEDMYKEYRTLMTWAFITAWNPLPEILSIPENNKRNKLLEKELKKRDLHYTKGLGKADDGHWSEDSFFIKNISTLEAVKLGNMFGQKAIVMGERGREAELLVLK